MSIRKKGTNLSYEQKAFLEQTEEEKIYLKSDALSQPKYRELTTRNLIKKRYDIPNPRKDSPFRIRLTPRGKRVLNELREDYPQGRITEAYNPYDFIPRISAFIFFIAGISFAVASDFSSTGHAISSTAPSLASLPGFLSILLAAIGGYLFIKSK